MRRTLGLFSTVLALVVASAGGATAAQPASTVDRTTAIVELAGDPLATSTRTRPTNGRKIDFSRPAVKSERARLAAIRNDFKQWLSANAPKAQVTGTYDIAIHGVAVKLNGTSLQTLRSAPQVVSASLQAIYRPVAHDDPDLELVRANEAWTAVGGAANAGAGVKVAVVDTGIDLTHPCFNDAGYAAQTQLGDPSLTNNKVIAAKFFNNKARKLGVDASDQNSHGTHVAGTIGCNAHTPASIDGVDIPYDPSGVAPPRCSATTTSSRAVLARHVPRTSSTRSKRPTRTASMSPI